MVTPTCAVGTGRSTAGRPARPLRCVGWLASGTAAPEVLDELAGGRLGGFQAAVLAKTYANPRVADALLGTLDDLFEHADHMQAWEFERVVDMWSKLVDDDGSFDARERAIEDRSMSLGASDESFVLRLLGPAIDGEWLRATLQRYIDAEWKLDWNRCVAEHGDDACPAKVARTATQRRYDAFLRMLHHRDPPIPDPDRQADADSQTDDDIETDGAAEPGAEPAVDDDPVPDDGTDPSPAPERSSTPCTCGSNSPARAARPEAIVNLMIDLATFEHTLQRLLDPRGSSSPGGSPPGGMLAGDGRPIPRPDDLRRWCSQTTDGRYIPPADIVLEAIHGRIRAVITDKRGVVLNMGHLQRLFRGALRDAVMLAATRCTHAGCLTCASHSQADHTTPHSHGGPTNVDNGNPGCTSHNLKRYQYGFTTVLDEHGYWHTYRPDGTEIR